MSEFRRRLMMNVPEYGDNIPRGCVPLLYIEGTGTQWIDTEHIVMPYEDIFLDFQYPVAIKDAAYYLFGWRWDGTADDSYHCVCERYFNYALNLCYGIPVKRNGGSLINHTNTTIRNYYKISPNEKKVLISGKVQSIYDKTFTNAYNRDKGSVYPCYIFTVNNKGTETTNKAPMRLYEYSLTDANGNYTQRLIPILDKNGVACMYDTVRKKYHYNKGTGEFLYKILEQ